MGKAGGGVFEWRIVIPGKSSTPEVAVLANCPQVEAGHAEGFGPHLRIPTVEAPEVEIR